MRSTPLLREWTLAYPPHPVTGARTPNPKQALAHACPADILFFGGVRGADSRRPECARCGRIGGPMSGLAKDEDEIGTVEYQTRVSAEHRPCGLRPCDKEFPCDPWRWCSGCLIAALRADLDACRPYLQDGETAVQCIERERKDIEALMVVLGQRTQERDDERAISDALGRVICRCGHTLLSHRLNGKQEIKRRFDCRSCACEGFQGQNDELRLQLAEAQATIARLTAELDDRVMRGASASERLRVSADRLERVANGLPADPAPAKERP